MSAGAYMQHRPDKGLAVEGGGGGRCGSDAQALFAVTFQTSAQRMA